LRLRRDDQVAHRHAAAAPRPARTTNRAIAEYLLGQGFPGQFPYATAAYREMYLDKGVERVDPTR